MAISGDGSVVVGWFEDTSTPGSRRAFAWRSDADFTVLGNLASSGGASEARAACSNGSVVVGYSLNDGGDPRAVRWSGTMASPEDLGVLTGASESAALGVSADGTVVVGISGSDVAAGDGRAFIWTAASGVSTDAQSWLGSVVGVNSLLSTSQELTRTHMEGAHHRPLAELGRGRSYWITGDIAGSDRSRDLKTWSGEAGVTFAPSAEVLIGVGGGFARQELDLAFDGSGTTDGEYLVGEIDLIRPDGGIFSLLLSAGDWESRMSRGYDTSGGISHSHGRTDVTSRSARLRYDTPVLARAFETDFRAYGSYAVSKVSSDGYTEEGGSLPGSFGEVDQTVKEGRLGLSAVRMLGEKARARLSAEWIRRFDRNQSALTATDITNTIDLSLPTPDPVRDQARFGLDLDWLIDSQTTVTFTVHAAGRGESPDVSGAISLRKGF